MTPIDLTESEFLTEEANNFAGLAEGSYYLGDGRILEIDAKGVITFYRNGRVHRDGGPAYINPGKTVQWRKHGMLHREDGPAHKWDDGKIEFWLFNRRFFSRKEWKRAVDRLRSNFAEWSVSPAE